MMPLDELIAIAKRTALAYKLDPALVCAVVEQESAWNPYAVRFEPAFYSKYVQPQQLPSLTEAMSRGLSWGLMQVMGQVAREFGFKGMYLSMLTDPYAGLDMGCRVLQSKLATHAFVEGGLLAFNGGANGEYPKEVLARKVNYGV